jgi:hypothetical protein
VNEWVLIVVASAMLALAISIEIVAIVSAVRHSRRMRAIHGRRK